MVNSATIALIIVFLHACTWEGEIFAGIKKLVPPEKKVSKPIYGCPICMTPWWGSLIYWVFFHISFPDWVLTVGAAAGMSVISVAIIDVKDYFTKHK